MPECCKCLKKYYLKDVRSLRCKHVFCCECLVEYLGVIKTPKIKCFVAECTMTIPDRIIRECLTNDQITSYEQLIMLSSSSDIAQCLTEKCPYLAVVEKGVHSFDCEICLSPNCLLCKRQHYEGNCPSIDDDQVEKQVRPRARDTLFDRNHKEFEMWYKNYGLLPNIASFTCPVCEDFFLPRTGVILRNCLHTFCRNCLQDSVGVVHNTIGYVCLQQNCKKALDSSEIFTLINDYKWTQMILSEASILLFQCRKDYCSNKWYAINRTDIVKCSVCGAENCMDCDAIHNDKSCEQYRKTKYNLSGEVIDDTVDKSDGIYPLYWSNTNTGTMDEHNDSIIEIKKKIHDKIGLPSEDQRLEYLGESLDDDKLACEYRIRCNSDVTVLKPIKQKTRGICLVISNEHFTNNFDPRTGTKKDEKRIRSIFEPMGYKVKIHRNVRNSDMDNVIEDTMKLVKSSHKILIVFILSHGEEKGVYTSDEAIIPFQNICTPFTNTMFPLFAGKPKIVFFVCCQGSNENPGVDVAGGSMTVYDSPTRTITRVPVNRVPVTRVPATADLFLVYATCPSYVSCRTATEGTFYVSTLCDVIEEHPRWSVVDIHQEVQRVLSRRRINDGRYFQMPYYESSLKKRAYFVDQ